MSNRYVDVVFNTQSGPRSIFSVLECGEDGVKVFIKPGTFIRSLGIPSSHQSEESEHNSKILDNRFSIHSSDGSPSGDIMIKWTQKIEGMEDERTAACWVSGVKNSSLYAPVFSRRCTALSGDSWNPSKRATETSVVGTVNLKRFSPFICLFAGLPNAIFNATTRLPICVHTLRFRRFSLVLLHSYIPVPAHDSGAVQGMATLREFGPMAGFTSRQAFELAMTGWSGMREELCQTISAEFPEEPTITKFHRISEFMPHPSESSREYKKWILKHRPQISGF